MVAEEVPLWAVQLRIEIIGGIDQLLGDVRQTLIAAAAKCRIGQTFGGCQHTLRIRGHSRDGCRVERAHTGDAGQQRQQQYNHHSRPYRRTADQRTAVTTHVLGSLQVYGTRLLIHSALLRPTALWLECPEVNRILTLPENLLSSYSYPAARGHASGCRTPGKSGIADMPEHT